MSIEFWNQISQLNILRNAIGASDERISTVEKELGVSFATEYKQMLSLTGACMVNGHEIVGISHSKDLDVVEVTTEARRNNPDVSLHWYVVENAHFDGIIIWQDAQGAIYQTSPGTAPIKIANSLAEYISA